MKYQTEGRVMRRNLSVFALVFSVLCLLPLAAQAELRIDVNRGVVEPMPIAVTDFYTQDPSIGQIANQIPNVVMADLKRSGLFAPVNPQSFIQDSMSISREGVRFPEWRAINTQALVTGTATRDASGRARIEFRLWDVFSQQQLVGIAYMADQNNWRRIAHKMADEIYKRITGEQGYFDSRIVYVSENGPVTKRVKRLAIMDQDGANHRYLTDGSYMVLTPRFSPSQQQITYMSYYQNRPRVYLYDINSGRQELLGDFPGMTFAPRFSPDGRKVVMSYAKNGNTEIYVMDLGSRSLSQLTNSAGIDTAPSYSPDGSRIAFESDRGGSQQIYVMSANGGSATRISFGEGRYGNPVWSPRGDLIAFIKMLQGKFYIGVMRPDGSGERLLTTAYHVEGPSWSPNGRVLTYFKETPTGNSRSAKVYTIDLTGHNEQRLPTPADGSDPAWSPLNQ